ncbi:MAG: hypothetical protein ACPGVT_00370 [Maricaulaceae bacterium]
MKLNVMENSFNSFGGSVVFKPLEALFYLEIADFGTALSEVSLTLQFNCALPFEQQNVHSSLRSSYDNFIKLTAKPKRTFRRKKAELEVCTKAGFVSTEDFFPKSIADYKTRNETYFRDWNLAVLDILIAEMKACKSKFKKTDDFDFTRCLAWMESLHQKMPSTKDEADILCAEYSKCLADERSQLSDWELLGEDWSDYHKSARDVVPLAALWDIINDFAPNGNDTGADVLYFFQENKSKIRKSKDNGKSTFVKEWERMWGESIPEANGNYDDLALDDYKKYAVGYAFAYLKCLGFCPEWLSTEALKHINAHEVFSEREYPEWDYLDEFKAMNVSIKTCLKNAPVTSA